MQPMNFFILYNVLTSCANIHHSKLKMKVDIFNSFVYRKKNCFRLYMSAMCVLKRFYVCLFLSVFMKGSLIVTYMCIYGRSENIVHTLRNSNN